MQHPEDTHRFKELSIKALLDRTDSEQVVRILKRQLRHFPQMTLALKTALIRDAHFDSGINKYDLLLGQTFRFNTHGTLDLTKREISHVLKTCQVLIRYLRESIAGLDYEDAFSLIEALLKRLHILLARSSFNQEKIEYLLGEVYDLAYAFARLDMSPELKTRYFHFGIDLGEKSYYKHISFRSNIFQAIFPLCPDNSAKERLLQAVETSNRDMRFPEIIALQWYLTTELYDNMPVAEALPVNGISPGELHSVLGILIDHKKYDCVLRISPFIAPGRHTPEADRRQFYEFLLTAATQLHKRAVILSSSCALLGLKPHQAVLEHCKTLLGNDWQHAIPFLYSWSSRGLSAKASLQVKSYLLAELEKWDQLSALVSETMDLDILEKYAAPLFRHHTDRTIQQFVSCLSAEVNKYIGPRLNLRILESLDIITQTGPPGAESKIRGLLLEKFPERISLKNTLNDKTRELQ